MAAWALMNPPAWRSKDNTRSGMSAEDTGEMTGSTPDMFAATHDHSKRNLEQPPIYLIISRASTTTVELSNAATGDVMYRVEDTGRGRFSSKPDYEIWRPSAGGLLAGSVRIGVRGTTVDLPLTGVKIADAESYTSSRGNKLTWTMTVTARRRSSVKFTSHETTDDASSVQLPTSWAAVSECHAESTGEKLREDGTRELVCSVKLVDSFPNGRIEIWTKDACVDIGGDWNLLDELVAAAYANMERARRKLMMGPDPAKMGVGPLGMTLGVSGLTLGT